MNTLKQVIHDTKTNSVEATWVDADDVQVKCHSYSDVQMDMLEADLGIDLPAHAALIATVRANVKPIKPPTLAELQVILKQKVAAKRWQVESGGTTVAGIPLRTDAESQSKMIGALAFVGRKQNRPLKWKGADGKFRTLTKAQIEALSDGAGEFVAKCFDAESGHCDSIDALDTVDACQTYDVNTGWPS